MSSHDRSAQDASEESYHDEQGDDYIQEEEFDPREEAVLLDEGQTPPSPARAYFIRSLALLCACSLSIGSH